MSRVRVEKKHSTKRCLAVNLCLVLAMAGVRAHSVGHAEGVAVRDLCQHLQHMGSKTLQLAHRQSYSN